MLWLLMLIVSLLSFLLLVSPLRKSAQTRSIDRLSVNKKVYQDRVKELELEKEQQQLTEQEFNALEAELKKNLLEDAHLTSKQQEASNFHQKLTWSVAMALPVLALVSYYFIADWQAYLHWEELQQKHEQYQIDANADSEWLEQLTNQELLLLLRTRLYKDPDDTRGWLILGQTLGNLGAAAPAQAALTKALQTSPKDTSLQLTVAQVMTTLNQASAIEQAEQLVEQILANNADHEGAMAILGFVKARKEDYAKAIELWQQLIERREARGEGEGQGVQILKQQIEQAKALLAQQSAQPESQFGITAKVTLAEEIQGRFPANTRVFIIVRGDDGMPAPVAVKPMMIADLPAFIQLTDADAMMPGRTMSQMNQLFVSARISFSGSAAPQSGDWQSSTEVVDVANAQPIELEISAQIP